MSFVKRKTKHVSFAPNLERIITPSFNIIKNWLCWKMNADFRKKLGEQQNNAIDQLNLEENKGSSNARLHYCPTTKTYLL